MPAVFSILFWMDSKRLSRFRSILYWWSNLATFSVSASKRSTIELRPSSVSRLERKLFSMGLEILDFGSVVAFDVKSAM